MIKNEARYQSKKFSCDCGAVLYPPPQYSSKVQKQHEIKLQKPSESIDVFEFLNKEEIKEVYIANLKYVIKRIVLPSNTIITADHGELLGESGQFGHITQHRRISEVPWFRTDGEENRETEQLKLIKETDWDLLIVLDACRYDYFRKIYSDYLNGKLNKAISPATCTKEWKEKVIKKLDFSSYVYVSGNPFIRSNNSKLSVIDCWKNPYPEPISRCASRALKEHEKVIAHYMQPHRPYIPLKEGHDSIKDIVRKYNTEQEKRRIKARSKFIEEKRMIEERFKEILDVKEDKRGRKIFKCKPYEAKVEESEEKIIFKCPNCGRELMRVNKP